MYGSNIVRIPTDAASHLICIIAAVAMISAAVFIIPPVLSPYNGIIDIDYDTRWMSSPLAVIINTAVIILLVLLISSITNRFSITSSYSVLPTLFFLLFQCSNPITGSILQIGNIAAIAIMLSSNILFSSYQRVHSERAVFGMTLFLGVISLFWIDFVIYIPIIWIGLAQMNSLRLKSFLASLLAIITIVGLYFSGIYFSLLPVSENIIANLQNSIENYGYKDISHQNIFAYISTIPALVILFTLKLNTLYRDTQDKISVQKYNMYINTLAFLTFIFMLLNPNQIFNYMPIFNSAAAIEAARYFDTIKTKIKLWFLYSIIIIYLTLYIIWIL